MKVLYFGDVYGRPGREAVKKAIEKLRSLYAPDFIIINRETQSPFQVKFHFHGTCFHH